MGKRSFEILDVTLRDGSHAMSHAFTPQQVLETAIGLDEAGIRYFEVSHGDGLGGSSLQYGLSTHNELELIELAADACKQAEVSVLLIPGIGVKGDLQDAVKAGAKMVRVATHVTEADVAAQHIALGRELGLKTVGFLMMSHMASVEKIVEHAKLFESYGAEVIYVTDSAGYMLPQDVTDRISALKQSVGCEIGFHGHNNLSMAMANTAAAVQAGATYIDGSLRALGAGMASAGPNAAARLRHARSTVLLEQLLAARAVQRARHVWPQEARASLLGDHALGYLFGLAASQGDPTAAPPTDRALAAALRHIHGLVFGMQEAHRLVDGALIEVGAAFGDGLLAAEADLQALLTDGAAAMPTGLLAGLPWLRCCGGDPTARPH